MDSNLSILSQRPASDFQEAYRQKLQTEIKNKTEKANMQASKQDQADRASESKKIQDVTKVQAPSQTNRLAAVKDRVEIRSLLWEQNDDGEFQLKTDTESSVVSTVDLKDNGSKILRSLGHKIDFLAKLPQLKVAFMQNLVQSRSANFFLSKFAQFKVGLMGQLLGALGVTQEEIRKLKKEAIKGAIEDNIQLMGENLYNAEISELIHGRHGKMKRAFAMFKEIENQLRNQMALLGRRSYWSNLRFLEEKMTQLKKIEEEFVKEKGDLEYQLKFRGGDT